MILVRILLALLPVLAFLGLLIFLDSYKLTGVRHVLRAIVAGCLAAGVALAVNLFLLDRLDISFAVFTRYPAPAIEELLKAFYIAWLIRVGRVGFVVDAAILGFAVGTGFSLVENVYYLTQLGEGSIFLWIVRGFGTAVLHGSTTAVFAILTKGFYDRHDSHHPVYLLPGAVAAYLMHAIYNHFILPPLLSTVVLLLIMPLVLILVFERSERATRRWLGTGFDSDAELLERILSGEIRQDRVGRYLDSLKNRFPGPVVGDMFCLLRIHTELSMRAKGILLAREAGLQVKPGEDVRANLEELEYLEKSIGPTGKLALAPFLATSRRDLWQLHMLQNR